MSLENVGEIVSQEGSLEIVSQEGSAKSSHVRTQLDGDALPHSIQQVFPATVLLFWARSISKKL